MSTDEVAIVGDDPSAEVTTCDLVSPRETAAKSGVPISETTAGDELPNDRNTIVREAVVKLTDCKLT